VIETWQWYDNNFTTIKSILFWLQIEEGWQIRRQKICDEHDKVVAENSELKMKLQEALNALRH
jgi:hypothetical protein